MPDVFVCHFFRVIEVAIIRKEITAKLFLFQKNVQRLILKGSSSTRNFVISCPEKRQVVSNLVLELPFGADERLKKEISYFKFPTAGKNASMYRAIT